jgi:hypothetical protein
VLRFYLFFVHFFLIQDGLILPYGLSKHRIDSLSCWNVWKFRRPVHGFLQWLVPMLSCWVHCCDVVFSKSNWVCYTNPVGVNDHDSDCFANSNALSINYAVTISDPAVDAKSVRHGIRHGHPKLLRHCVRNGHSKLLGHGIRNGYPNDYVLAVRNVFSE